LRLPVLISVRASSTRLPGKAFTELGGAPATARLVRRMGRAERPSGVVVCTSTNPADDVLEALARELGVTCVRGAEEDKLERYLLASRELGAEFLLIVDGDDLLCDPEAADAILACYEESLGEPRPVDYAIVDGLPLGATPFGVRVEALASVCARKRESNTEVWGSYFADGSEFETRRLAPSDPATARSELRLTLDYREDLELIGAIYDTFGDQDPTLREAIELIDSRPGLADVNRAAGEAYAERIAQHAVGALPPSASAEPS
jgi:spore coat polysaccharide biosynthesis protein SpsF